MKPNEEVMEILEAIDLTGSYRPESRPILMPLTDAAVPEIVAALAGNSHTNWATPYIGVGDSSAAFSASQTDLQASTNKLRKAATITSHVGSTVTLEVTFFPAVGEGEFAWQEWDVFSDLTGGIMLCRKAESLGTMTSEMDSVTFNPGNPCPAGAARYALPKALELEGGAWDSGRYRWLE